jgi:hypothetical protein
MKLLEYRGPQNHVYGIEHLSFAELRPYWVGSSASDVQGYETF